MNEIYNFTLKMLRITTTKMATTRATTQGDHTGRPTMTTIRATTHTRATTQGRPYIFVFCFLLLLGTANAQTQRYWIGKDGTVSGNTNWSNTQNWSLTSDGAPGASVPTAAMTVIFDDNSFTADGQAVILTANSTCDSMIWKGTTYKPVFDMVTFYLAVSGSLELQEEMTLNSTSGTLTFNSTRPAGETVITRNVNIPKHVTFNAAAGSWTMQDSLKMTGYTLTLTNGNLDFDGNYLNCNALTLALGTLNLNGSTVVCDGTFSFTNGILNMEDTDLKCNLFATSGNNPRQLNIANATIDVTTYWNYENTYSQPLTAAQSESSFIKVGTYFYGRVTDTLHVVEAGNGVFRNITLSKVIPYPNPTIGTAIANLQNVTTDTLILEMGKIYHILNGSTVTVNKYFANVRDTEDCSEMVYLRSTGTATPATTTVNIGTGTTVDLNNINLYYVNITGYGAPYTIKNVYSEGAVTGYQSRLYWIGGAGNWDDLTHWSTQSGGTPNTCFLPGSATTVVFDDNSGLYDNDIVTLNVAGACDSMIWETSVIVVFNRANVAFSISGSLILQPYMTMTGASNTITFNSPRPEETITTHNTIIPCAIAFNSATCKWVLQDALISNNNITFTNGNLDFNEQYVKCATFTGTAANGRELNIANSVIDVTNWIYTGNTVMPVTTNSTIRVATAFTGNPVDSYNIVEAGERTLQGGSFQKIIMNKNNGILNSATAANDVITDTLILEMGNTYYIYQGSLVTVNEYLANTHDLENCDEKIILSSTEVEAAYIEMVNITSQVDLTNMNFSYIEITGPGTDYYVPNSYDLDGNSGWNTTEIIPTKLFWVGGTGNWTDRNHWATESGGTPICTYPTKATTVVFDDNSGFTDEATGVTLDMPAFCDSMIWLGTTSTPTLTRTQPLTIAGSLVLQPGMTVSGSGLTTFTSARSNETITTNGVSITGNIAFNNASGGWKLEDPLTVSETITLSNGNLDLNSNTLTVTTFTSTSGTRTLNIENATINATTWNYSGAGGILMADNSVIKMTTGNFTGKNGDNYNVLEAPTGTVAFGNFSKIIVNRGAVTFNNAVNQNIYTDTLLFAPGSTLVRIFTSATATSYVNVNNYLGKTHANQLAMNATNTFPATINMGATSTVKMDTLILSNITITGPGVDYPTEGSVDKGGNTGWDFINPWVYDDLPNTYYWRGGLRDGIFNNIVNWELGFPGSGITPGIPFSLSDDLVFPPDPNNPASMTLTINGAATNLKNLYFNAGSTVTISNTGNTMTASGSIVVEEGSRLTMNISQLNVSDDIIIKENGALTIGGTTAKNIKVFSNSQLSASLATNATSYTIAADTILIETGSLLNSIATNTPINIQAKYMILNGSARFHYTSIRVDSTLIMSSQSDVSLRLGGPHVKSFIVGNLHVSGNFRYTLSADNNTSITTTINQNVYIYSGGSWNIRMIANWTGLFGRAVNIMGDTYIDGEIRVRNTDDQHNGVIYLSFYSHGNFEVTGTALFNRVYNYFRGDLMVTGEAEFIDAHTYLQSSNPYTLTLGTPTTTSFTGGTFRFDAPAALSLTEDLIMPSTDLYITTNNNSLTSNGYRIKSNLFNIANGSTAMTGRMLDFSNSLLEVKDFTLNGTRTGEHNFNTTTISFWDTVAHNFNVNLFNDPAGTIGKVTFSEVAPKMTFTTAANGVRIDSLETGDQSIFLNYTNTNANYALTANVWHIKNPCDIYAMLNPIINVKELIVVPAVPCGGVSQLRSLSGLIQLNSTDSADPIELRYLYCRNVNFDGTVSPFAFISPPNYDLGGNTGSIDWAGASDPDPVGTDFYWIGGEGDWFDENNWSFDQFPPKTPAHCIPTLFDNAFFDEYSFSDDTQNVTVNAPASIKNITWTDPYNRGAFMLDADFTVNGSADFTGCRYAYSMNNVRVIFAGKGNETITSGGLVYNFDIVNFSHTGTYTLMDDFILSQTHTNGSNGLYHYSGTFISNGYNITCSRFNSTSTGNAPRALDFSGSIIKTIFNNTDLYFRYNYSGNFYYFATWTLDLRNLTGCDMTDSQIITYDLVTNGNTTGNQSVAYYNVEVYRNLSQTQNLVVSYNKVSSFALHSTGTFGYGFTTDTLFLANGAKTYTFNYHATAPNIYTISTFLTDAEECLCNSDTLRLTLCGTSATALARFNMTQPNEISRVTAQNVFNNVDGTGSTLTIQDGIDNGNNTNVNILARTPFPAIDFYWVGGSGNWSDYTHWSVNVSGGDPLLNNLNQCIPSQYDSVIFDHNSFPADYPQVVLDIDGFCKSMTWTSGMNAYQPDFGYEAGIYRNLYIYGSLELSPRLTRFQPRLLYMMGSSQDYGTQIVNYNGINARMPYCVYFNGGGRYDILSAPVSVITSRNPDNVALPGYVYALNGSSLHLQTPSVFFEVLSIGANSSFYSYGNPINFANNANAFGVGAGTIPRTIDISGSIVSTMSINWSFDDFTTIDISNTNISITTTNGTSFTFANGTIWNAANSNITSPDVINLNNPSLQEFAFHNITLTGTTAANATLTSNAATTGSFTFNKVEFTGLNTRIMGPGTFIFDTLIYRQSSSNLIEGGKTLHINEKLITSGTPCANIELSSTNATPAVINSVHCNPLAINFAKVTDVHANLSDGCATSDYTVYGDPTIQVGADGWTLYDLSVGENTLLGLDLTLTCIDFPYTQTSEGFGVGDTYTWYYKPTASAAWTTLPDNTPTLNIENPGFYSLRVDYGTGCYLGGPADVVREFIFDTDPPPAVITSSSVTNALSCADPTITLTANEIIDPTGVIYTYSWKDTLGNDWGTGQSIIVSDPCVYTVIVTGSNHCFDSAAVSIRLIPPTDLMDCILMEDKSVFESGEGLGYYQHSGADWDATAAPCANLKDSTYYITIAGTDYSGHTLDGFQFPLGTTNVMWVAEDYSSVFDTCYFEVIVKGIVTNPKLTDCSYSVNRIVEEDDYLIGYYTHIDNSWDLVPYYGIIFDSVAYYFDGGLHKKGLFGITSLNTSLFAAGITTHVTAIAFYEGIADTCEFDVFVMRACPATIADDEGHVYKVTNLAGKCWTENLQTTLYPGTTDPIPFANPYTCAGCPAQLDTIFGLLYTWYSAVNVPEGSTTLPTPDLNGNVQGICPAGWHLPCDAEWNLLGIFDAKQLMSTNYWLDPPGNGTDDFGFTALPAGRYDSSIGKYTDLYGFTGWWSSDATTGQTANYFEIAYYCSQTVKKATTKSDGLSVRCVLD